jgi:hypothetical protein
MWRFFMGKSQNTPQLAVGMNGKRGFGDCRPHIGFFLRRTPQQANHCQGNSYVEKQEALLKQRMLRNLQRKASKFGLCLVPVST